MGLLFTPLAEQDLEALGVASGVNGKRDSGPG